MRFERACRAAAHPAAKASPRRDTRCNGELGARATRAPFFALVAQDVRLGSDSAVEKFDDVKNFLAGFEEFGAGAQLQDASRIAGNDGRSAAGLSTLHFFLQKLHGRVGFCDVVNAGGATALIGERHFHQFQAGNSAKQSAGGFVDFLPVREVAGILKGNAHARLTEGRGEAERSEKFRDVPNLGREFSRIFGVENVAGRTFTGMAIFKKEMRVFLEG